MEKLIVGIILALAVIFLANCIRKLAENPTCASCDGNCSGCQIYRELQIDDKPAPEEKGAQ